MNKDNLLLYTAVIFLFLKRDKPSAGIARIVVGAEHRPDCFVAWSMSGYLLPLALLIIGGILYLISTR